MDRDHRDALRRLADSGLRVYVDDDGCVSTPIEQWADGSDRLPNHHNSWWQVFPAPDPSSEWEPLYRAEKARAEALAAQIDDGLSAVHLAGSTVERASVEVDRASRALAAANARADAAEAKLAEVRALHHAVTLEDEDAPWCNHCSDDRDDWELMSWPCATVRALDAP